MRLMLDRFDQYDLLRLIACAGWNSEVTPDNQARQASTA